MPREITENNEPVAISENQPIVVIKEDVILPIAPPRQEVRYADMSTILGLIASYEKNGEAAKIAPLIDSILSRQISEGYVAVPPDLYEELQREQRKIANSAIARRFLEVITKDYRQRMTGNEHNKADDADVAEAAKALDKLVTTFRGNTAGLIRLLVGTWAEI